MVHVTEITHTNTHTHRVGRERKREKADGKLSKHRITRLFLFQMQVEGKGQGTREGQSIQEGRGESGESWRHSHHNKRSLTKKCSRRVGAKRELPDGSLDVSSEPQGQYSDGNEPQNQRHR